LGGEVATGITLTESLAISASSVSAGILQILKVNILVLEKLRRTRWKIIPPKGMSVEEVEKWLRPYWNMIFDSVVHNQFYTFCPRFY
jgi:hypothetical protein